MKLVEYPLKDFVATLASNSPAPGGGSTSAVLGSLGVALTSMVANLTVGKQKFIDKEPLVQEILGKSQQLTADFLALVDRDTEAFNQVSAVFAMPKATDDEKAARRQAMQAALKHATVVPYAIIEKAGEALRILEKAVDNTNPSALSDLGVAASCLAAAAQGGWLNVLINLGGITDQAFVADYKDKGGRLLAECAAVAANIQKDIEARL